jgi:pimeloyl-[acyl-carrier protein] methyl ester esterase
MRSLVLLHGWGARSRIWQRQAAVFGRDYTVLTPDIPTWEAGWLAGYLSGLDLRECVLVGWSLGGMLLLETLAREGLPAPGALVLVGVAPVFCRQPDHPWGQPVAAVRAMRRALKSTPRQVINDFARACIAPGEESYRPEAAAGFDFEATPVHLAQGLDYLKDKDLRGLLPQVSGRVVIIQGEADRIVPPAQGQYLQRHLPGAQLRLLPDAGHLPFMTQAQAFNRILKDLIGT